MTLFWEILGFLAGLFFVGSIVCTIVGGTYQVIAAIVNYLFSDFLNRNLIFTSLDLVAKEFLVKNFRYYHQLNASEQVIFERRVQKFMNMKNFEPRGGLDEVTLDMMTLISASAIQITFGHPSIYFRHFDTILVYPDHYRSPATGNLHKGEVQSMGVIVLSWAHFFNGYLEGDDGRNLGLHEMAHAWKVADSIQSTEYDSLDPDLMLQFVIYGRAEMERMSNGEESFFRKYAASNDHEFFAVAVENFFERPVAFQSNHPELFHILGQLLNQPDIAVRTQTQLPIGSAA